MEIKEIKRRLKSIQEIYQITKAMKTVATFRLKKSRERIEAARPFARKINEVLIDISGITGENLHPMMERRASKRFCLVVFTSDRGLCGAFNVNIIKRALQTLDALSSGQKIRIITVGRKGHVYFKRLPYRIIGHFEGVTSKPTFEQARRIADFIREKYLNFEVDEVVLIYSRFYSALNQKPRQFLLLPISPVKNNPQQEEIRTPFIYEPSPREILDHLVSRYLEVEIFRALLETDAGENGARMISMSASVNNAQEMKEKLIHQYHQARQSTITRELSEVVGGARAVQEDASE